MLIETAFANYDHRMVIIKTFRVPKLDMGVDIEQSSCWEFIEG